jgi:hypothetical protein
MMKKKLKQLNLQPQIQSNMNSHHGCIKDHLLHHKSLRMELSLKLMKKLRPNQRNRKRKIRNTTRNTARKVAEKATKSTMTRSTERDTVAALLHLSPLLLSSVIFSNSETLLELSLLSKASVPT